METSCHIKGESIQFRVGFYVQYIRPMIEVRCRNAVMVITQKMRSPKIALLEWRKCKQRRKNGELSERLKPIEEFRDEIADHNPSACSQYAFGAFEGHILEIEDTGLSSGVDHGKFTADLVGGYWKIWCQIFGIPNDVKVAAGRLHHDNICTFGHISLYRTSGKTATAWGKLVAPTISE